MASDRIVLTVPARGEYAKTARMTAAELASRIGMSYDEVDDVRMAAEEAFVYASAHLGAEGDLTFAFTIDESQLTVTVGPFPSSDAASGAEPQDRYAAFILESVCDEFSVTSEDGTSLLSLVKRSGAPVEG